jgi:hypothetical protein
MARSRQRKETPAPETPAAPAETDTGKAVGAEPTATATDHATEHALQHACNHADPATPRPHNFAQQEKYKRPAKRGISAGPGVRVNVIEHGNRNGVGIQIDFPEGRKPTAEELAIIHEHLPAEEGYRWEKPPHLAHKHDVPKEWHKAVGEDAHEKKAVAIRLSVESRAEALAVALNQHAVDPVGYAELVKQQRENASGERIPD